MKNIHEKITPCPFCGSLDIDEALSRGYERGDFSKPTIAAGCMSCGARGPSVTVPRNSAGYEYSMAKWNKRNGNPGYMSDKPEDK